MLNTVGVSSMSKLIKQPSFGVINHSDLLSCQDTKDKEGKAAEAILNDPGRITLKGDVARYALIARFYANNENLPPEERPNRIHKGITGLREAAELHPDFSSKCEQWITTLSEEADFFNTI